MDKNIALILPAYNESENIELLVSRCRKQGETLKRMHFNLHIVLINDGSTDNTEELCVKLSEQYDHVFYQSHAKNKGLGKALETGIFYALSSSFDYEYVAVMDCDNTHDPQFLADMLEKLLEDEHKDIVIASRYQKGSRVFGVPFYRFFLSYGALFFYTIALHLPDVRDYTCGYRMYRVQALRAAKAVFAHGLIRESGFSCMVELLYKMSLSGAKCTEVPFHLHYEDKLGQSKMHVAQTTYKSFALVKKLRKMKKDEI